VRYDKERNVITTSVREIVSIARRGISPTLTYDEDEPNVQDATARALRRIIGECHTEKIHFSFKWSEYAFEFSEVCEGIDNNTLTVAREITSPTAKPSREETAEVRGEAFILAYALAQIKGFDCVLLRIVYINPINLANTIVEESVKSSKLEAFFKKCVKQISTYARPEIERVTVRLESMKRMSFPYKNVRDGQSEFIRTAYRALARGGTLYASAPTGTGKTVSALYPALRALGDGRCDKIFYLTPKSTTGEAVRECIAHMTERGAVIRAIILTAKDKCCINRRACKLSRKNCPYSAYNNLAKATLALYDRQIPTVDRSVVSEIAREWSVCPYELSLCYAELCDVVVCDFNHLFDPVVYIRRFFSAGGRYALLIDEAHNLVDRAREMYSAELSVSDIKAPSDSPLLGPFSTVKQIVPAAAKVFEDQLMPLIRDELRENKDGELVGAASLSSVPTRIYELLDELVATLEGEIKMNLTASDDEAAARVSYLRSYYYTVKKFADTLARFDESYRLFLFCEGGELRARLYCLDTSPLIRERLDKGRGALLFSATLSPIGYYRSLLGGERSDDVLEIDSPFDQSQLSVTIMDKISTRYSEREDTLAAVSRVIAATVSAKRGHYMVFSPSFAYSEALAAQFSAKYPKVKTLIQTKDMSAEQKNAFLEGMKEATDSYLVAFCVMGGIYSEGIDLAGESLIGAVVVGIGMPQISFEREALTEYYDEKYEMGKQYAYIYPGMNRVFQAAGRVIRREDDRGVIVLIDDRFDDPIYKKSLPSLWKGVKFIADPKRLREILDEFWQGVSEERRISDGLITRKNRPSE